MADIKKTLYSVALNSQGYLLYGVPRKPARVMSEARKIGEYPSVWDEKFSDASSFLPWAQTDFSGGFQSEKWEDKANFKTGAGLEYLEHYGQVSLLNNKSSTLKDFGAGFTFGASVEYDRSNVGLLIGITKGSGASELWKMSTAGVFTQITGGTWANVDAVYSMDELQGKAYIGLTVSLGNPLKTYDGSTVADITLTGALASSLVVRMVKRIETRLYVGGYTGTTASGDALMYSDDEGTTWSSIITKTGKGRQITQGVDNLGTLYFLIEDGGRTELWWCNDITATQIYRWESLTSPKLGCWLGKVFVDGKEGGKMKRFEWNGAVLRTVFEEKVSGLDVDTSPMIVYKNNLHSYGLIYDGLFHFPSWVFKYGSNKIYPFAVFESTPYFYGLDGTFLKITKLDTSAYLTTGSFITGIYTSSKPAITKLWHSITVRFKALASGQTIVVAYSDDDESTWTTVGTISPVSGEKEETLYYPANTKSKQIQLKFTLTGGGTDTPILLEFVQRFLLVGEDKYAWSLSLNCSDNIILLNGRTREPKRGFELRELLRKAQLGNDILTFQDIDYTETQLNGALTATATTITVDTTLKFPEQGRIKIDDEEIPYTGKTATAFTGCTRGARGTLRATHTDNTLVSNEYKVMVRRLTEQLFVLPKPQANEYLVSVSLLEV